MSRLVKIHSVSKRNLSADRRVLGKPWKKTYRGYFGRRLVMRQFVDAVLPKIPKKRELRILYAGSGTGALGEELVEALGKKGITAKLTLLDASQEQLSQNSNPKTRKIQGDLLTAQMKELFDVIIMRSTLDYFPSKELQVRVLSRLRNWLAKGGVFFNQAASLPTISERNLADRIYRSNPNIGQRHFQAAQDISAIYQKAGFEKPRKIGDADALELTQTEHEQRYGVSKSQIRQIQRLIQKKPQAKHLKVTAQGYRLRFGFPIYAARKK